MEIKQIKLVKDKIILNKLKEFKETSKDDVQLLEATGILEFFDSGDGVTHEVWRNKETKEGYNVPIEIVRDFSNATKI